MTRLNTCDLSEHTQLILTHLTRLNTHDSSVHTWLIWTHMTRLNTQDSSEHTWLVWTHMTRLNTHDSSEHMWHIWTHVTRLNTYDLFEHTWLVWTHMTRLNTHDSSEHTWLIWTHMTRLNTDDSFENTCVVSPQGQHHQRPLLWSSVHPQKESHQQSGREIIEWLNYKRTELQESTADLLKLRRSALDIVEIFSERIVSLLVDFIVVSLSSSGNVRRINFSSAKVKLP